MKNRRCSDYSIEDDIPLKKFKQNQSDLQQYSQETCKICSRIFHTRFDHYIHYAQHIVILVKKDTWHPCKKCNFCSTTQASIQLHMDAKHITKVPDILANFVKMKPVVRCNDIVKELIKTNLLTMKNDGKTNIIDRIVYSAPGKYYVNGNSVEFSSDKDVQAGILESIVKMKAVVKCDDSITKLITAKKPGILSPILQPRHKIQRNKKTSNEDIKRGMLKNIITKEPIVECDNSLSELIKANNERNAIKNNIIGNMVDKTAVVQCDNNLTALIAPAKTNARSEPAIDKNVSENVKNAKSEPSVGNYKNVLKSIVNNNPVVQCNENITELSNCLTSTLRSRLIFEDDDEVELNFIDDIKEPDYIEKRNEPVMGKIMLGSKIKANESVHNDVLMKPGLYFCKHCAKTFPNRFLSICHEQSHLKFRRNYRAPICHLCDKYIAGNHKTLNQHIMKKHPDDIDTPRPSFNTCNKCGLKYHDLERHLNNHHFVSSCETEVDRDVSTFASDKSKSDINSDVKINDLCYLEKVISICDVCSMFMKNTYNVKYIHFGEKSEIGKRQTCERCFKECFEVNQMKRLTRRMRKNGEWKRKHEENKSNSNKTSNEGRLKNIQHRLKMLNKLTRF